MDLSKPPSEGEKDEYTVFVTNLPFTASESMIRDHFLRLFQKLEIDEVRLPRHTGTNKVKGFAYVQLRDRRIVPQVIEAVNKTKLDGRTITVEKSQTKRHEEVLGYTVHVSNLSFKVHDE